MLAHYNIERPVTGDDNSLWRETRVRAEELRDAERRDAAWVLFGLIKSFERAAASAIQSCTEHLSQLKVEELPAPEDDEHSPEKLIGSMQQLHDELLASLRIATTEYEVMQGFHLPDPESIEIGQIIDLMKDQVAVTSSVLGTLRSEYTKSAENYQAIFHHYRALTELPARRPLLSCQEEVDQALAMIKEGESLVDTLHAYLHSEGDSGWIATYRALVPLQEFYQRFQTAEEDLATLKSQREDIRASPSISG